MNYPKIEYKNVKVKEVTDRVTPQMIDAAIARDMEGHAMKEPKEGPAVNHDIVNIDFTGYVDDVAFPGGEGKGYDLELGSGTFIPGFEPQLVGLSAGDEKSVFVTFPKDYMEQSLAGKKAEFKCRVNGVYTKKLPELNDEFASHHGFNTVAEYRADISGRIEEDLKNNARFKAINEVMEKLVKANRFEIPKDLMDKAIDSYLADFLVQYYQITDIDEFCRATGADREALRKQVAPAAENRLRGDIIMSSIAEEMNFTVTSEEYEHEVQHIAESYYTDADTVKKTYPMEMITQNIRMQKVLDLLYDTCVEKGSRLILS